MNDSLKNKMSIISEHFYFAKKTISMGRMKYIFVKSKVGLIALLVLMYHDYAILVSKF